MVRTPAATRRIYQMFFDFCPVYRLARPWAAITPDPDSRACPEDPSAMVTQLANHFADDDLIQAGVAERACMGAPNEGALVPAPPLSPGAPLIFLRYSRNQAPIEILTAAGGLSGWHPPILACLDDYFTIAAIALRKTIEVETGLGTGDPYVLAAFTIDDVVILRALGLPATLATGMDSIDRRQLFRISQRYGWKEWSSRPAGFGQGTGMPGGFPGQGREAQKDCPKEETPGVSQARTPQAPTSQPPTSQPPTPQAPTPQAPGSQAPKSQARAPEAPTTQATATQATATAPPNSNKSTQTGTDQTATKKKTLHEIYLEQEAKRAREPKTYQDEAQSTTYPDIILLGWSPARLSLETPAPLAGVKACLQNIQNYLQYEGMAVGIWIPPSGDVDRLRFKLRFNPCLVARDHMFFEIQDSSPDDAMLDNPNYSPPATNYVDARAQYSKALRSSPRCDPEHLERTRDTHRDLLERDLIQPLHQPTASAAQRILTNAFMDVSRLLLLSGPVLEADLSGAHGASQIIARERLQPLDLLLRNLLKLNRELRDGQ